MNWKVVRFDFEGVTYDAERTEGLDGDWWAKVYNAERPDERVQVSFMRHYGPIARPDVNWSAHGAQSPERAAAYGHLIIAASEYVRGTFDGQEREVLRNGMEA